MSWRIETIPLQGRKVLQYHLWKKRRKLTVGEVWNLWQKDDSFRLFYSEFLLNQPFEAFFWEHPAYQPAKKNSPYEVIVIESNSLARVQPDPQPFQSYFLDSASVVSFRNIGGDAMLLVPCPDERLNVGFPHLAAFVRQAAPSQLHEFWKKLGQLCDEQLGSKYKWLSTAGMGVSWLHVRLDARPKYYRHGPYRTGTRES